MGSTKSKLYGSPVARLLASKRWQSLNSASQPIKGGALTKMELIVQYGLPPMHVISSKTLASLGRFPPNKEGYSEDARKVLRSGAHANIMLLSHRWLRPKEGKPDDENHTKLNALLEFCAWYNIKYPSRELYFWIDYTCIGWDNRDQGIAALPAYVCSCTDLLCFQTVDYHDRAWCRLERAVAYAFMFSGAHPWILSSDVKANEKSPQAIQYQEISLEDPLTGQLTVEEDRVHIRSLLNVAYRSKASEAWGMSRRLCFDTDRATRVTGAVLK